ncbi:MAG TPA: cyclic nucleotide-binding domain-containing protein, partial [Thermoanaerobaculia bacterium]|nr:cyclic nucleotide-binding domain-containing protein [Thermoanaerobaculia bacterium]
GSGTRPVALLLEIGLPFSAPPREAEAALMAAARSAPGVVGIPQPRVFLFSYGDSAIVYRVRVWTKNVHDLNGLRDAVYSRMWYELERRKIVIPFPIRTVYMHQAREEERELEAAEHERAVALFSGLDLFSELDQETVETLATSTELQAFDDGEALVEEGASGDSLFVIAEGTVAISKKQSGGGIVELATLGSGEFFGEMSLLTGEPRSATVAARGVCRVLKLTKAAVAPLIQNDPKVAEALSRALAARRAEAAATLERERGREQPKAQADQISLLRRIRSFFTIGGNSEDADEG